MYQIRAIHMFAEKDSWENGCDPKQNHSSSYAYDITGSTQEEVIQEFMEYIGTGDKAAVMLNAGGDPGRVDIQVLARPDDWSAATREDIEKFKVDKVELWLVTYTARIENVCVEPIPPIDGYEYEEPDN